MWANCRKSLARIIIIATAALQCAALTAPVRAEIVREYKADDNWLISVHAHDDSKRFSHCVAAATYNSGTRVYVSIDEYLAWFLGFANEQWRLTPDRKIPVRYRFDEGAWRKAIGAVRDRKFFFVHMPEDKTTAVWFRRSRQMALSFSEGEYQFELDGTSRVMSALADCVIAGKLSSLDRNAEGEPPPSSPSPKPASRDSEKKAAPTSGTGIVLSSNGHVLTNNHVVSQCKSLAVVRSGDVPRSAQLLRTDPQNDLAVIKVAAEYADNELAIFRSGKSVRAGETVAAFGFPLAGTLSVSGNISSGNVTSLSGIRDDVRYFQISAPVQPGNSGGPLIDASGLVVGIVTARLDDGAAIASSGAIPQNVNFAIKGTVATSFLEAHSLDFRTETPQKELPLVDVTERAKKFSVLIICD